MKIALGNGLAVDLDVEQQFKDLSKSIERDIEKDFAAKGSKALETEARNRAQKNYPGSEHWDPLKINAAPEDKAAAVDVDIAGAVRAYWDVNIYPVTAPSLVYPTEEGEALGLKEWKDIYQLMPNKGWFQPKGHPVIMGNIGGELIALFHLRQHVFQGQDFTLLPTDQEFCAAICDAVMG